MLSYYVSTSINVIDKALTEVIKTSFNEGRECYGTRRIQQDLNEDRRNAG